MQAFFYFFNKIYDIYVHITKVNFINMHDLLLQGYLDEQFHELEDLEDDVSPNFVEEVVNTYFKHSSRLMAIMEHAL